MFDLNTSLYQWNDCVLCLRVRARARARRSHSLARTRQVYSLSGCSFFFFVDENTRRINVMPTTQR